ncbi:hypothetical protein [Nocardia shimofusensis]|uniref:hypothetical protein n=1 Tax=Nocardia shimofusensis TaxID=228596 RepID=UPI000836F7BC|nr:hypothetical protein [Nocardia shimofusensis]
MGTVGGYFEDDVLRWLLEGEVAVRFQTCRDLLDDTRPDLRARIASEGAGAQILAAGKRGGWGRGFYEPKWTCAHYSLLELRDLAVPAREPICTHAVASAAQQHKGEDGGFNPADSVKESDVCMNGMFLAFSCYFGAEPVALQSVVDFVLGQQLPDGGFNCRANRSGARTASVHSTTSVIDGFAEFLRRGYSYRADDVRSAIDEATTALLDRHLYQRRSDGKPIRVEFTRFHEPARWHFDVLRGLDVLRGAGVSYDSRLADALDLVRKRRRPDGRWVGAAHYPGRTHVSYPRAGTPNRWVTLRALRVLRHFESE